MALSGLEIFKLLPKTNCKECGYPTCLAFAMNLSAGKTDLSECPYVSEEVETALAESERPPIKTVTIGVGDNAVKIGGERALFRHEKRFENPPGLAMLICYFPKYYHNDCRINHRKIWGDFKCFVKIKRKTGEEFVCFGCELVFL